MSNERSYLFWKQDHPPATTRPIQFRGQVCSGEHAILYPRKWAGKSVDGTLERSLFVRDQRQSFSGSIVHDRTVLQLNGPLEAHGRCWVSSYPKNPEAAVGISSHSRGVQTIMEFDVSNLSMLTDFHPRLAAVLEGIRHAFLEFLHL